MPEKSEKPERRGPEKQMQRRPSAQLEPAFNSVEKCLKQKPPHKKTFNRKIFKNIDTKGRDITDAKNIEILGGKVNAIVKIMERWLPVINGVLVFKINKRRIFSVHEGKIENSKLTGIVDFDDGSALPVINNKTITKIDGEKILSCQNCQLENGKLTGIITLKNGLDLPIIKGGIIRSIEGVDLKEVKIGTINNDEFNGVFVSKHGKKFLKIGGNQPIALQPESTTNNLSISKDQLGGTTVNEEEKTIIILNGKIIDKIGEYKIVKMNKPHLLDGAIITTAETEEGFTLPVVGGKIIDKVAGKQIHQTDEFEFKDCKISGVFKDQNRKIFVVVNDKVIDEINGVKINAWIGQKELNEGIKIIDGKIFGTARIGSRILPIYESKFINEVEGVKIIGVGLGLVINKGEILNGLVYLQDGRILFVEKGKLIQKIDGRKIQTAMLTNSRGQLEGKISPQYAFKTWLPVVDGKILREIDKEKIKNAQNIIVKNGIINGIIEFESGIHVVINGKILKKVKGQRVKKVVQGFKIDYRNKVNAIIELEDGRKIPIFKSKPLNSYRGSKVMDVVNRNTSFKGLNGSIKLENGNQVKFEEIKVKP